MVESTPPGDQPIQVPQRTLWKSTRHNPVQMLQQVAPERLETLARDPRFLTHYDEVKAAFDAEMAIGHLWFPKQYPTCPSQWQPFR